MVSSTTEKARIMVKAPPASGKTALLQAVVRSLLKEGKPVIIARGTAHMDTVDVRTTSGNKVVFLKDVIEQAPDGAVLIIDDAQLLYNNQSLWDDVSKGARNLHVLAAASYSAATTFPDTPDVFSKHQERGFWDCSFDTSEMNELATAIFKESHVPEKQRPHAIDLFAQQCRVLTVPSGPQPMDMSGEEEKKESSVPRVHVGLFRRLLETFRDRFRPGQTGPSAWELISSPGLLQQDQIKRCFGAFDMKLEDKPMAFLRQLFVLNLPVAVNELTAHVEEIQHLVRSCVVTEVDSAIDFSTPVARRVFFRKAFPSRGFQFLRHTTIDGLILDAIRMFDPKMLVDGKKSSKRGTFPSEAVLQQEFCRAVSLLIPPSILFCPEMSEYVKSGRVDFFIGALGG
jgi:hypothetical protein